MFSLQLPGRWTHHPTPTHVRGQREMTNQRSQRDQWVSRRVLYYKQYQIYTHTRVHMFTFRFMPRVCDTRNIVNIKRYSHKYRNRVAEILACSCYLLAVLSTRYNNNTCITVMSNCALLHTTTNTLVYIVCKHL